MSSTNPDHAEGGHAHPWYQAHHFDSMDVQNHAVRLGMWLFLGTEVLLFAGLFLGYTVYRWLYHPAFHEASRLLSLAMGGTNTVILIYLIYALLRGEIAGDNPWNSKGIEWMTTSPPDKHNFPKPIVVTQDPHSYQKPGEEVEHVVI